MRAHPLLSSASDIVPLSTKTSEACCSLKSLSSKIYNVGSIAFSAAGNWPFFGAAATFGNRYSPVLGNLLGSCEFAAYFAFRIRNFQEVKEKLFSGNKTIAPNSDAQNYSAMEDVLTDDNTKFSHAAGSSLHWKSVALKTGIAALGIVAQFPIMYLVYVGNGEQLAYPILSGVCEASFTILSLLMSLPKEQRLEPEQALHLESVKNQIDRFLDKWPEKIRDPAFMQTVNQIFSDDKSDEQRGRELLELVLKAEVGSLSPKTTCDRVGGNLAKAIGYLIASYLTVVNGAVSYRGVLAWKPDQVILATLTTITVSLANIQLLTSLCANSAKNYYEGARDYLTGQFRPPLAHSVSPACWYVGRILSNIVSWLSFGTTALGALNYFPAGDIVCWPAPLSSALLLNDNLVMASDDTLLWIKSQCNSDISRIAHIHRALQKFRSNIDR